MPPFEGNSQEEIFEKILNHEPDYPSLIPFQAQELIKKLLNKNPEERFNDANNH